MKLSNKCTRINLTLLAILLSLIQNDPLESQIFNRELQSGLKLKSCVSVNTERVAVKNFLSYDHTLRPTLFSAEPETLNILALRIEFQPDDTNQTTGNGTFGDLLPFFTFDPDQGIAVPDLSIDSRDPIYYHYHLKLMSQYYDAVSQGLLHIVVPEISPGTTPPNVAPIVRLTEPMSRYGGNDQADKRLTEFVRDAVVTTDNESNVDFSQFDFVMIFHAGSTEQTDLNDDTPDDLQAAFVSLEALRFYVADEDPEFLGIPTNDIDENGNPFFVKNAVIVPETAIQDVEENPNSAFLGILGIMAHEFGHALGLPDLFDTIEGRSADGNFALMATGLFNGGARLPAHPIGWSKFFLGWVKPLDIIADTSNVQLAAINLRTSSTKLLKVFISSSEYFLLENRVRDENFNSRFDFDDKDGNNFPDYLADDYFFENTGTFAEFDYGLPGTGTDFGREVTDEEASSIGSGVLIWHIDEEVIREKFDSGFLINQVNTDPARFGVALEEADGIRHLVNPFPTSIDPGFGSPYDAFGGEVPGLKDLNSTPALNLEFSTFTNPNTESNIGLPTYITISGFRSVTVGGLAVDSVYAVDFKFRQEVNGKLVGRVNGFPYRVPGSFGFNSPAAANIDNSLELEIAHATPTGEIYLISSDGTNFVGGTRQVRPFAVVGDSILCSPALGDVDGDGFAEVVVVTVNGGVHAFATTGQQIGQPLAGFPLQLDDRAVASPVLSDLDNDDGLEILVATSSAGDSSSVYAYRGDAVALPGWPVKVFGKVEGGPAVADLDSDGSKDIVVATTEGEIYRLQSNGGLVWIQNISSESIVVSPSIGDLDGRRNVSNLSDFEIVVGTTNGSLAAISKQGEFLPGWPVKAGTNGRIDTPISIGDVDKDGIVDIVALVDETNRIRVYDSNGRLKSRFPKNIPIISDSDLRPFFSAPILANLFGDEREEVIFGTSDNLIQVFDLSSIQGPVFSFVMGGDAVATPAVVDLTGDGNLNLISSDDNGFVYAFELGIPSGEADVSWGHLNHDAQHTSANLIISAPRDTTNGESAFSKDAFYFFPNPATGDLLNIAYNLDEGAIRVQIEIFTVSGIKIRELEGTTEFGGQVPNNTVAWDIDGIPSGVYIIRLGVTSIGNRSISLAKKAAIVK